MIRLRNLFVILFLSITLGLLANGDLTIVLHPTIDTDAIVVADSLPVGKAPAPIKQSLIGRIKEKIMNLEDSTAYHPKFIQFCLDAYRWVDKNFNTYDSDYVISTGKTGKVTLSSDNWLDAYNFRLNKTFPVVMMSHPYSNIGISVDYSILSVGYSVDIGALVDKDKSKHRKTSFAFSCARLYIDGYYWQSKGGSALSRVGATDANMTSVPSEKMEMETLEISGLYIFNYKRFSLPAAYGQSTYQLRSQGTWLAGISGTFCNTHFDFSSLPKDVLDKINLPFTYYKLDYNAVNLMGGYAYNWVPNKHWLYNIGVVPGFGITFSYTNSSAGRKNLFSLGIKSMTSLSYHTGNFFTGALLTFNGNMFVTKQIGILSGLTNFQVLAGYRF